MKTNFYMPALANKSLIRIYNSLSNELGYMGLKVINYNQRIHYLHGTTFVYDERRLRGNTHEIRIMIFQMHSSILKD